MKITRQFLAQNARLSIESMGGIDSRFKHPAFIELAESMRRIETQDITPVEALVDHVKAAVRVGSDPELLAVFKGSAVYTNCESLIRFLKNEGAFLPSNWFS